MIKSVTVLAVALFACLNLSLNEFTRTLDQDGAFYALREFYGVAAHPRAVFVGSSLSKHVYLGLDEHACLREKIASLAYNLQLPSDSLLLIQEYLRGSHKPDRIIMPFGPRDFFDNDSLPIYRTLTFKRVVPLSASMTNLPLYASDFGGSVYAVCERICPMYSYRVGARFRLLEASKFILSRVGYSIKLDQPPRTRQQTWRRSLAEYQWRYQGITLQGMSLQMSFFQRAIGVCKKRHIEVVVVNLPLSQVNLRLLPPGFERLFRNELLEVCHQNSVKFVDAASILKLTDEDFEDSAHLNKTGARKVLSLIFEPIVEEKRVAKASSPFGEYANTKETI